MDQRPGRADDRTIEDATVKTCHYDDLESLKTTSRPLSPHTTSPTPSKSCDGERPYQVVCKAWTKNPAIFKIDLHHLIPGPHNWCAGVGIVLLPRAFVSRPPFWGPCAIAGGRPDHSICPISGLIGSVAPYRRGVPLSLACASDTEAWRFPIIGEACLGFSDFHPSQPRRAGEK